MKESGLVKFKHFWKNKKGAVTIEFLFMSMFLIVLFAFLFDLVMLRSTLGKLDNASYTLVSILRERTQLYDRVAQINIDDHKQFEKLAKKLIYGDQNSNKRIDVVLEYWAQDGSGRRIPNIIGDCTPYKNFLIYPIYLLAQNSIMKEKYRFIKLLFVLKLRACLKQYYWISLSVQRG